jgi:redox-sensitive bicupin YhaK (pirin superfamily)
MQTVTVVLEGALEHKDHTGSNSVLRPGDVQWMTAGHGVLHSELPRGTEPVHTLQLWLNLPAASKMIPARYVDQRAADVPRFRAPGAEIRIYAGQIEAIAQPHGSDYPMTLHDIRLDPGASWTQDIPAAERAFLYVLGGEAEVGSKALASGDVAWSEPGGGSALTFTAKSQFRALLFAGLPIDEPVVSGGPFVMNTAEEIEQAFDDYRRGKLVA